MRQIPEPVVAGLRLGPVRTPTAFLLVMLVAVLVLSGPATEIVLIVGGAGS